ncbi:MAG: fructose-6-phosphate aldolase [Candidatus Bipolaricaulota bacterium]|jgi:transaldolase|nr:fructose-6-phosphate aldolase [Candidatus Bipolaricaulota bacterium]
MKLYIDSANLDEIRDLAWLVDGVTTNPSLVAREKVPFEETIARICELVDGPVSAEVMSLVADDMVREGRALARIHPNVVIKVPMTEEGMKAVQALSADKVRTNVTLVFSANQALVAAKCGASFVSPFVGRVDDVGGGGMDMVSDILDVLQNYVFPTEVIVASVRHPRHVFEAAALGAEIATVPHAILKQLFRHPLTDAGIERFLKDWKAAKA